MLQLVSTAAALAFMAQSSAVLVDQVPTTTIVVEQVSSTMHAPPLEAPSKVLIRAVPTPTKLHGPSNGSADVSMPDRCRTETAPARPTEIRCPRNVIAAVPPRAASVERTLIESLGLRNASGARVRSDSDQQDASALTANAGATLSDKSGQAAAILSARSIADGPDHYEAKWADLQGRQQIRSLVGRYARSAKFTSNVVPCFC